MLKLCEGKITGVGLHVSLEMWVLSEERAYRSASRLLSIAAR